MKRILPFVIVAACAAALSAQTPADRAAARTAAAQGKAAATAAADKKPAAAQADKKPAAAAVQPAAAQPEGKPARARAQASKQGEEGDDGTVMIDSKAEMDDGGYAAGQDYAAADVPGGIPSSYGQCKGVVTEAGRTVLVFESIEDGSITFVQVFLGKNSASWKLLDKVGRSAD